MNTQPNLSSAKIFNSQQAILKESDEAMCRHYQVDMDTWFLLKNGYAHLLTKSQITSITDTANLMNVLANNADAIRVKLKNKTNLLKGLRESVSHEG